MSEEAAIHRVQDLDPEARAVVETLVGRALRDEDRVFLQTSPEREAPQIDDARLAARQREARIRLLEELEKLPVENPDDQMTAQEHDRVIYGIDP